MPTYDYECEACSHRFECFQKMTEDPVRKCPSCGKKRVRRLIGSGGGLLFKGSGFYITDYRSEGYKSRAKADQAPASGPSGSTASTNSAKSTPGAASSKSA